MKLFLILIITALVPAQGEWSNLKSVWQQNKEEAYSFKGVIKLIFEDEERDMILVRVENERGSEDFKVCEDTVESARNQHASTAKMNLIRDAFSTGRKVEVSFGGPFDHCLATIRYLPAENQQADI